MAEASTTGPGRRAILGAAASLPLMPTGSAAAVRVDALLVELAAAFRQAQRNSELACIAHGSAESGPGEEAAAMARDAAFEVENAVLNAMADIPAGTLGGLMAKVGCVLTAVAEGNGTSEAEERLAEAILIDIERLAPEALGHESSEGFLGLRGGA